MNKTLYVFRDCYQPNTAAINRLMAIIRGFSELEIKTEVFFVRSNCNEDKVTEEYPNVTFNYLWEDKIEKKGKFKYLQQLIWIISILRRIKRGEDLIVFGLTELLFIFVLFSKKINIYHEMTEHPDVVRDTNSKLINLLNEIYLKSCISLKGLFVISTSLKQYFLSIGVSEKRIHIINMIVDPNRFQITQKISHIEKYIAYCGSIINSKDGVDTLIESFNLIASKFDEVKLYIIGKYVFKEDEAKNKMLIDRYCLQGKVVFTGEISMNEMPEMLINAQVLVLARPDNLQAKNGFPTKLGEYLLTKNPVVVTNVGDISLFLKNGVNAYIAEPGNVFDIAEKICQAISNEKESSLIAKNGYDVAIENFNYLKEAKKICKVIFEN